MKQTASEKRARIQKRRRRRRIAAILWTAGILCALAMIAAFLLQKHFAPDAQSAAPEPFASAQPDAETPKPTSAFREALPSEEESAPPFAAEPTASPAAEATEAPAAQPTVSPTAEAINAPAAEPTSSPTQKPTSAPTQEPASTEEPAAEIPEEMPMLEAERANPVVTMTIAGDCTLGGDHNSNGHERFDQYAAEKGFDYFLANVKSIFEKDDLTLVNLEGPLTTATEKRSGRQFNFKGSPAYAEILTCASVEGAGVANNHARDYGTDGLKQTAQVLEEAGIGCFGYQQAWKTEINGIAITCLSVTEWDYSTSELKDMLKAQREDCDILVVMIHWGEEKAYKASSSQKKYGRALIDAGADLVIGSHSHVVGGLEKYNGKYILYSTGNFCFGGTSSPYDYDCLIFQQTFAVGLDGAHDAGIALIPCTSSSTRKINDFRPTPVFGEDARRVFQKMAQDSRVVMSEIKWNDAMEPYLEVLK